ncbi:ABC transporter substrate-binding protein [Pseudooceanicola sp. CBS1P-1]|uniref:ABC transporter substrate-binding protein n=1 Tax=Pseudooceanicola albus TaxID=2692189 RepID=A0A6L7G4B5_9RHOB|nr:MULTISPECIES: ABC transporter substrate-binding protein [Pseudooceanicola]MBT9385300.1 ABC transporter substrate-binding protein [Pseudooceanicola endophyticus]MXN18841.1 ABC transporter substrate-binding protein [Pseudooceanicola albus]
MKLNRRSFLMVTAAIPLTAALGAPLAVKAGETGTIRWLSPENTTGNWDPSMNTTLANTRIEFIVFDTLLRYPMTGDDLLKPELRLVESYEMTDGHTVDFVLKKGIKFHDGSELTAADVKATLEYYSREGAARAFYPGPVKVEVKDDHSFTVTTETFPAHSFLFLQVYSPILRAADVATPEKLAGSMIGTGPFRYVGTTTDGHNFEAFADYWGGATGNIQKIQNRYVPDGNARMLALMSGEAEVIERLEPEQYDSLKKNKDVATQKVNSVENRYLHFRCNKPPFNDYRVRRAAAAAIDREGLLSLIGEAGYGADSVLPPMKLGSTPQPDYGKYDPELCQKLLAEAGYPGGKGLPPLEYITSTGFYPKSKEICEAITAMLQAEGFPVTLTVMEVAAWNDAYYNVNAGNMIDGGWAPNSPEPNIQLMLQYYSKVGLVTGVNEPELDKVLLKQVAETDMNTRAKIISDEVLPMVAEKLPNQVLFNSAMMIATAAKLTDVTMTAAGDMDFTGATMA